jgi:hypothetical protein
VFRERFVRLIAKHDVFAHIWTIYIKERWSISESSNGSARIGNPRSGGGPRAGCVVRKIVSYTTQADADAIYPSLFSSAAPPPACYFCSINTVSSSGESARL